MFQITSILSSKTLILKILLNIIICTFGSHHLIAQGNYRFENFGNRSILLNGNVTGSVEDLGLTFYNPSRLALVDDPSFTITGKAYELNDISLSNAIGINKGLSSSKFKGIPSMVAGTFRVKSWDKHYFAYSFISRYRSRLNLGYTGRLNDFGQIGPSDDIINEAIEIRLKNSIEDEWVGLSWATKLNDHLAIGASLFLSLYEFEGNSDLSYYSDRSNAVLSYGNDILYNQKTNGLFLKLGASWIVRGFEMGLNVHLPYFNIRDKAKFNYKEIL
jgi:hypothetical protein